MNVYLPAGRPAMRFLLRKTSIGKSNFLHKSIHEQEKQQDRTCQLVTQNINVLNPNDVAFAQYCAARRSEISTVVTFDELHIVYVGV